MKIKLKDIEKFNELLLRKGFTKRQFGKAIGIGSAMVCQICNGVRNPGPAVAKMIAETLDTPWDDLFVIERAAPPACSRQQLCM